MQVGVVGPTVNREATTNTKSDLELLRVKQIPPLPQVLKGPVMAVPCEVAA